MATPCKTRHVGFALFLLTLPSFSILSTSTSPHEAAHNQDLISTTCNKTQYFDVCVSTLRSDPRSNTVSDLNQLAHIALNRSVVHGLYTLSYVKELKSNVINTEFTSKCLSVCIEEYDDAVANLEEAIGDLESGDYENVNNWVSTAMTDSDTCERGFGEIPDNESPLTKENEYFFKLCSNFLAIITLL